MNGEKRSVIFGRDAEMYEQARPSYPNEAIDHLLGLTKTNSVVEIGAGTGKATSDVARHGLTVTCLEPSPGMAGVLRARELPGVDVIESTFEDWDGPESVFDLIFAAQAWHWVEVPAGYEKSHRILRPGGAIALMWNVLHDRYLSFEEIYREFAPQIVEERDERIRRRDSHDWNVELEEHGFVDVARMTWNWTQTLDAISYRSLVSSYSDHMLVPEPSRTALLDSIEESVRQRSDTITLEYSSEVFSGLTP